jgi:hypothetical protein
MRIISFVIYPMMALHVRYWHKADMGLCAANVRYWG